MRLYILITALITLQAYSVEKKTISIEGSKVELIVHKPKELRPKAIVLIAPAKKYTMDGALFQQLAEAASEVGFYAVRFNWGFVTHKTEPSSGMKKENQQVVDLINYYKNQKRFADTKVLLVAKSFGSKIIMKGAYKNAQAVSLMTPNCSAEQTFAQTYGELLKSGKNVFISISLEDPYCDVTQIYQDARNWGKEISLYTADKGDHNFISTPKDHFGQYSAVTATVAWLLNQVN